MCKKTKTNNKKIYTLIKRTIDIILSAIGIIVLSPIYIILIATVKIEQGGKIFFSQTRIGKNGKKFKIYKFRTMKENAEQMLEKLTQQQKEEYEKNFKLENDTRVTKLGKHLRKIGLDELPQLWNILKGDMSIVGPRPIVQKELEKYGTNKEKFLSVKPGLTGYWKAYSTKETTYPERIQMELYYVENISLKLDIKIFIKTIYNIFNIAKIPTLKTIKNKISKIQKNQISAFNKSKEEI